MTRLIFRVNLVDSIKKKPIKRFLSFPIATRIKIFQRNQGFLCKRKHLWICDSQTSLKKTNPWKFETNLWPFQKPLKREKSTKDETQLKIYLLDPKSTIVRVYIFHLWCATDAATMTGHRQGNPPISDCNSSSSNCGCVVVVSVLGKVRVIRQSAKRGCCGVLGKIAGKSCFGEDKPTNKGKVWFTLFKSTHPQCHSHTKLYF